MVLVVQNLPANAGDTRDAASISRLERSPEVGNGNPLQYSDWRSPWTEESVGLWSVGSQRVRHDWRLSVAPRLTAEPPVERAGSQAPGRELALRHLCSSVLGRACARLVRDLTAGSRRKWWGWTWVSRMRAPYKAFGGFFRATLFCSHHWEVLQWLLGSRTFQGSELLKLSVFFL